MSTLPPCDDKAGTWPSDKHARKRRVSLASWLDPAMTSQAAPRGKRGRQPDCHDAAIRTCLTMTMQFGMALRQTTGYVASPLRPIGLDRAAPDFSTR